MTDSARFVYLADGTKLKTIDKDGHVVRYRGSLVIKQNSESGDESIAGALWDEGFTELLKTFKTNKVLGGKVNQQEVRSS